MTGSAIYDPGEEFLYKFGIENTTDDNKFAFQIIGLPPLHINNDLNGTIEAYITAIVGPDRLFLSQTLANITRISMALELDPPRPLQPQHIGRFAMVRLPDYKGTMTWMRALVIERTKTFAELFTIDIGNIYAVPLASLYKMSRYYVPIAPQAFPVRFTNMTQYIFLRDFKKLLWAKVNVKIYSYDNISFLSNNLEIYSSTDEQFDLSSARNALLKDRAGFDFTFGTAQETTNQNEIIPIPAVVIFALGLALAIIAAVFSTVLIIDIVQKYSKKQKENENK